jgi:uncharacterized protein YggE
MKTTVIFSMLVLILGPGVCRGQTSGNIAYSEAGGKAKAEQRERAMRVMSKDEMPPSPTSMFVEANVLMNVKADEYVAVFGITHEGETLADCSKKMDATIKAFVADLKAAGIAGDKVSVDFITQNRIYGFQIQGGNILQEKLVGFELKKNVLIHYQDPSELEKFTLAAAKSQVFDLIKVDYIVKDINRVQDKLMEEAARITKNKISRYEKLLGIKLQPPAQVYAEKSAIHYPTQMYDSYTAHGSEQSPGQDRERYTVRHVRKSQTFFFNGLDGSGFDAVISPVVTEPVVQCTLYLKVKYEVEQIKAK